VSRKYLRRGQSEVGLFNDAHNPYSMFVTPLTAKRDDGRSTFMVGQNPSSVDTHVLPVKLAL